MSNTTLNFPVVKGYSNARGVYAALTEPYLHHPHAPPIQSIIAMFVQWDESTIDVGKRNMPNAFERLSATDIAWVDSAKLHDVNYRGKPLSKKRIAELPSITRRQHRRRSDSYGAVNHFPLEKPFIDDKQRSHIQSMFPVDDFPFAHVLRIQLKGKRNDNFKSLVVIEPDVDASMQLTHYVMKSSGE